MEAARLAARLLQDHGREGQFEVWIDPAYDLELVATRLREMNCEVEVDPLKRILDVTCPPLRP